MAETFLQNKGNYRNLIAYQKAECIYDITYYFAHKYLQKGDRTIIKWCKQLVVENKIL